MQSKKIAKDKSQKLCVFSTCLRSLCSPTNPTKELTKLSLDKATLSYLDSTVE